MPTNVILGADTANKANYINNKTVDLQQQRTNTPLCITTARLMQHHHQIFHYVTPQPDCTSHDKRTSFHSYCYNVHWMLSQLQWIQLSIATILQVHRLKPRSSENGFI